MRDNDLSVCDMWGHPLTTCKVHFSKSYHCYISLQYVYEYLAVKYWIELTQRSSL